MNRVIKFRAEVKVTTDWVYGWYCEDYTGQGFIQTLDGVDTYGVKKKTVGQFTGLTDKNGMDIYEGDILQVGHLGFMCAVTFEDGCFQLKTNQEQGNSHLSQGRAERLTICGNIHQNPELLTNK